MRANQEKVQLTGRLCNLRIRVAHSSWGTAELVYDDGQFADVTGTFVTARDGDRITVEGIWQNHPSYGRQFKILSIIEVHKPAGEEGIRKWLASRCPGVGPSVARDLISRFGDKLFDVMEREPHRLAEISGITPARAEAIHAAYLEFASEREHKPKLLEWGLSEGQIKSGLDALKTNDLAKLVTRIQDNPYWAVEAIYGIGFSRADVIAHRMGLPRDSAHRVGAAMLHVCKESCHQGHVFVYGAGVARMTRELLKDIQIPDQGIRDCLAHLCERGALVREGIEREKDGKVIVVNLYYLAALWQSEEAVAEGFARLQGFHAPAADAPPEATQEDNIGVELPPVTVGADAPAPANESEPAAAAASEDW